VPGLPGLEGGVGLEPPVVLVVVVVFAIPPHAHATSAKSSGSPCSAERLVEPLIERIALTHLEWFAVLWIFSVSAASARYWTEV
jgi:hypothetical protein